MMKINGLKKTWHHTLKNSIMNEFLIGLYLIVAFITALILGVMMLNGDSSEEIDNLWDWAVSSLLWPKFLLKALFKFLTTNWR